MQLHHAQFVDILPKISSNIARMWNFWYDINSDLTDND